MLCFILPDVVAFNHRGRGRQSASSRLGPSSRGEGMLAPTRGRKTGDAHTLRRARGHVFNYSSRTLLRSASTTTIAPISSAACASCSAATMAGRGRRYVLRPQQNHAWLFAMGTSQNCPEIQIVRKNNQSVFRRISHNLGIGGTRRSHLGSMVGRETETL